MQSPLQTPYRRSYLIGLALILFSFMAYLLQQFLPKSNDAVFLCFLLNAIISLFYLGHLWFSFSVRRDPDTQKRNPIPYACWVNFVLIFTISAFSLNTMIPVFAKFPWWLSLYVFASAAFLLSFPYLQVLGARTRALFYAIAGSATVLIIYLNLYLLPLWPVSIIGSFFFFLSTHTFVPLFWGLLLVSAFSKDQQFLWKPYLIGLFTPLLILVFWLYQWHSVQTEIKDIGAKNNLSSQAQLPLHIALAQQLSTHPIADEIALSEHISQRFFENGFGINANGERKYHNPLAIIGNLFFGSPNLDQQTAVALINIRRDQRHLTDERLWTGNSLITQSVSTQIKVYPQYRLAYQEKILTIKNQGNISPDVLFVTETQQAYYTFHLPEGSIVTSLSLWVNGKEEKSRLTTKQRADSAFKTIVGVERRDPAIAHWREGNRVTVSVFPCTTKEDRIFKIGFSSPLKYQPGKLLLENVWFEGPLAKHAREALNIQLMMPAIVSSMPDAWQQESGQTIHYTGDYMPNWSLQLNEVPLSTQKFWFNGRSYQMQTAAPTRAVFDAKEIYLDINAQWALDELKAVLEVLKGKQVYALTNQKELIDPDQVERLYKKYKNYQFGLPCLYQIQYPQQSILITKTSHRSPVLDDLKGFAYAQQLQAWLQQHHGELRVVNMSESFSPFYKTLNELRCIQYQALDIGQVKTNFLQAQWPAMFENDSLIYIKESGLYIASCEQSINKLMLSSTVSDAPDHLMRLYSYSQLMRTLGSHYFEKQQYETALLDRAEEAYILSPVSSLLVLESQADYERFGIKKNENSLGNAEFLEGGAVPEPHEWALFGLLMMVCFVYWRKQQSAKKNQLA
jgi:XrtN system VIT domain protein